MPMSDKEFCKHFGHLEDHQFKHFNRALGVQVESKAHFKHLLDKGGFVPFEVGHKMAEKSHDLKQKKYDGLQPETMKFLHQVKDMADSKGNITVGDRFVEGLKKQGVKLDCQWDKLPKCYQKGGFKEE